MRMQSVNESKVILVGDPSVGKTSIIQQYNNRQFEIDSESTVGASFISKYVATEKGEAQLHIWDTAGQERYRSLIPMYSRNACAALMVVDVTNKASFDSKETWANTIKTNCLPNCKVYVIANKMDLEPNIPIDELERWAEDQGFQFFKTSAKEFDSVERVFVKVANDIIESEQANVQTSPQTVFNGEENNNKSCC